MPRPAPGGTEKDGLSNADTYVIRWCTTTCSWLHGHRATFQISLELTRTVLQPGHVAWKAQRVQHDRSEFCLFDPSF